MSAAPPAQPIGFLSPEISKALHLLNEQWGIAERRIKQAENVRGQEVVAAAIFELRYAGRKLVDALELAAHHNLAQQQDKHEKAVSLVTEAMEDCVKAKHDAIDAMTSFVAIWFKTVETKIGLRKVVEFFPDYLTAREKIIAIQERIESSRESRNKLRDSIYNTVERDDFDAVLQLYKKMLVSKDRVEATVHGEKWKERLNAGGNALSIALALAALVLSYLSYRQTNEQEGTARAPIVGTVSPSIKSN